MSISISISMNTALQGMTAQAAHIETAARTIAGGAPSAGDAAQSLFDLISAETAFRANAAVFETGADLWEVLAAIRRD